MKQIVSEYIEGGKVCADTKPSDDLILDIYEAFLSESVIDLGSKFLECILPPQIFPYDRIGRLCL